MTIPKATGNATFHAISMPQSSSTTKNNSNGKKCSTGLKKDSFICFFSLYLNQSRETISICFGVLAWKNIHKKPLVWILYLLLSAFFHLFAFFYICLFIMSFFFKVISLQIKLALVFFVIFFLFVLFFYFLLQFLQKKLVLKFHMTLIMLHFPINKMIKQLDYLLIFGNYGQNITIILLNL